VSTSGVNASSSPQATTPNRSNTLIYIKQYLIILL